MYFLNGDRIYIKPETGCASIENQLLSCIQQLHQINSGKRIFKLNFFADTPSEKAYNNLRVKLEKMVSEKFETPVICALIAQPPLTCRILVEAFYFDPELWNQEFIGSEHG
ncbi:MAG TPA: hypothetical protein ENN90_00375, partial [Mariniphaga anaerophila]|nr:hypothetical protein [Mariniphaga anaerophila]